jgi:hypothetical protein
MSSAPSSIPSLPVNVDPQLRQFLSSIKENLEVRLRQRGNALDAAPTFRDLIDTGLLKIKDSITTIGGRQYTAEQLLGLVEFTLPDWITSDTAPPAPTGLVVSTDKTNTILGWSSSTFDQYAETEVWRATDNNLSTAVKIGSTSGSTFTDGLPDPGVAYYYWIRDVAYNFLAGPFNDVNGASTNLGPGAMLVSHVFVGTDVELFWPTPTSNLAVSLYAVEYLDGAFVPFDLVSGNSYRFKVGWAGARQFRLSAIDINGNQGPFTNVTITVTNAGAPQTQVSFDGEQVVLTWVPPAGSLPVDRYEVYDTTVSSGTLLATLYATVFRTQVTWLNKTLLLRAIDSAGNPGDVRSVPVQIATGSVINLTTEVIDNNVLFRWGNVLGSLPIATYDLRRGPVYETAIEIGRKDGGFTTVFEAPQTQSVFTYWLVAIDTAGNYGTPVSVSATVNQPPDYVLATNYVSAFAGTKSNAVFDNGFLVLPVNTTETWESHFTTRGWAGPAAQVSAGYPVYIQPGATTGFYEEIFDYGATLAAMKVTVSYLLSTVAGSVSSDVVVSVALDSGFTSNVQTFPSAQGYGINFRFVKVRVNVTATNDQGIAQLANLAIKLDTKLKNQAGAVFASASDSGGTTVFLTEDRTSTGPKTFIDVESITVAAQGTTPLYAIYDFTDTFDPLSFKILLFNSSGTRVSGTVSYSVRGF